MFNVTIFAVDDEQDVLELYESALGNKTRERFGFLNQLDQGESKSEAFDLHLFKGAKQFLKALKEHYQQGKRLPLVILDTRLSGMYGLELTREIRRIDSDIVILIVTAYADYTIKELIAELKNDFFYLRRPFRSDELYILVNSSLKQWNARIEAKHLEKELATDASQDGFWDWNPVTNEVFFSRRWKEMLGFREGEFENSIREWSDWVHPDDQAQVMRDVQAHIDGESDYYVNEHRMRCRDGGYKWVLDRGKASFDAQGKAVRVTGFCTDITERKRLEEELRSLGNLLSDQVEEEVSERMKLQHTNAELERQLKEEIERRREKERMLLQSARHAAMGEMIGMIAHQWRQPITGIGMSANNMLLDLEMGTVDSQRFEKNLTLIIKQVDYLSHTIDDFRNFFRPNKTREEVTLHECLEKALAIVGKSMENHGIRLEKQYGDNTRIPLYRNEIVQVFINLIKNAEDVLLEKKIPEALVRIETAENNDFITICVSDNGGGIEETVLSRVFEPYFSTKNEKTGTGLGLYMAKTIIEEHCCGDIRVENASEGALFTITIPKISCQEKEIS